MNIWSAYSFQGATKNLECGAKRRFHFQRPTLTTTHAVLNTNRVYNQKSNPFQPTTTRFNALSQLILIRTTAAPTYVRLFPNFTASDRNSS